MIKSFLDKESEQFYITGKSKKIPSTIHKVALEMALRLSKYFGTSPQLWLNLQNQYDLYRVSTKKSEIFNEVKLCDRIVA